MSLTVVPAIPKLPGGGVGGETSAASVWPFAVTVVKVTVTVPSGTTTFDPVGVFTHVLPLQTWPVAVQSVAQAPQWLSVLVRSVSQPSAKPPLQLPQPA